MAPDGPPITLKKVVNLNLEVCPYFTGPFLKELIMFFELWGSGLLLLVDVFRAADVELVLG